MPWNCFLPWSERQIVWFDQCQSCSVRYAVTRHGGAWFGVGRSSLHCGPAVCSLNPHLVGNGEKNDNAPVSPPQTRCPKPFCLSRPHCAMGATKAVCPARPTPVPWRLPGIQTPAPCALVLGECHSLTGGGRQALSCPTALQGEDHFLPLWTVPLT